MTLEWKNVEKDGYPDFDFLCWVWNPRSQDTELLHSYLIKEMKYIKYWQKVEEPSPPKPPTKPEPKYLTFPEALRVVLDGGTVKPSGIFDTFCFEGIKGMCKIMNFEKWIIVEPAPKPKMPDELKAFTDWLFAAYVRSLEGDRVTINEVTAQLRPLLNLYQEDK